MRLAGQFAAILAVALVACPPAARAEARHAAMAIDANSGRVLHAQAADEPRFPASLTKMMTLYMAFELIDMGRLSYQSRIKISQEAASAAPSKLDLDPGEDIALIDAVKALITKSANDIAIAVAEHIGGTEANFARLMTAKARQIGMNATTFRNASGLPDPGQLTTARDMLTLALRLQDDFPRHYGLFSTRSFAYNGGTHRNHNTLLTSFAGADGIKTGYTRASGFNLVSSVRRDGRHVVAAVFGGSTAASRNAHMRVVLTRALAKASTEKTRKPLLLAKPRLAPRPSVAAARRAEPSIAAAATPPPGPPPAVAPAPTAAPPAPIVVATPGREPPQDRPEPRPEMVEPAASALAPTIEIARVRRVMVAPRARPGRQHPGQVPGDQVPGETTDEAAAGAGPGRTAAPDPDAPVDATETVLAKRVTPRVPPDFAGDAIARQLALSEAMPAVPAPAAPAEPAMVPAVASAAAPPRPPIAVAPIVPVSSPALPPAAAGVALGRAPSTLQQQAQSITGPAPPRGEPAAAVTLAAARGPAPPSYRLQGPASPASPSSGDFQIQVGAYGSAGEAERQLASVRGRAGSLLAARSNHALPVSKGDRQLYRARFAGFDANGAASACHELRRLGIDCFVMRAE